MKKLSVLFSLIFGLFLVSAANAQTPITYKVGTEKVLTITVKAKSSNKYAITVKKGQVVNVMVEGNIGISKANDFPVISINMNYKDGVDRTQDGEAYYSMIAGRNGKYIISVGNSAKESRTFKLKVTVSNNKEDFLGGEEVDQ
jgi:hypothetical protein